MMQAPEGTRARVFANPPELCGHRGSGRGVVDGHAENTLESHRAAVEAGVSWVEVDARLTADGVLVARHDPFSEDGRPIAVLTAAETDRLGLVRFADLLDALPAAVGVNIEIKTALEDALRPRDETTAAYVAELAAATSDRRPLLVSSFDPAAVTIVREGAPDVPLGLLTWGGFPLRQAIPAAVHLGVDVAAVHFSSFNLEQTEGRDPAHAVRVAHEAGLQVLTWCPGLEDGDRLIAAGVDCLIVDDVRAAVAHYRP
jgi:glycerophosphoryl diester phosphodiesterase